MARANLTERLNPANFSTATLVEDLTAGVVLGIESVPDGLAAGLLALVNPVYGLYGYMVGKFTGAFFTSSAFMSIQSTGAMAVIIASVPQVTDGPNAGSYLFALSILCGVFMLAAGLLKMGQLVRFVPNSVMTGFVNAVAINIILSQLGDFTGFYSSASSALDVISGRIPKTIDLVQNLPQMHLPTLAIGVLTIVLIVVLERTRLGPLGLVVAVLATSLLLPLVSATQILVVNDIASIPDSLPRPQLPPLTSFFPLIVPALSLTFVALVQSAGISKNFVNPDGEYPDTSRDFVGQGVANLAAGVFQGMPVGGSMSATALVASAGARTRLANIVAGLTMAVVILLFGSLVGRIAMPALAGLLIVIGFRTLKPKQFTTVWKTGTVQRATMLITFLGCLLIPLQYAVLIGVALSVVLYFVRQSNQVVVKQWQRPNERYPLEVDAPPVVPPEEVTVLVPYGSLFFATAALFESELPAVMAETRRAVVVLHLRQERELGSTFLEVLSRYTARLHDHDSLIMLSGVDMHLKNQIEQTGLIDQIGRAHVFMETPYVGQSMEQAYIAGEKWIAAQKTAASGTLAVTGD